MQAETKSSSDRWFVTNGVAAIGPMPFDLLTRSVAHGRIPASAYVRHESWQVWRRYEELDALDDQGLRQAIDVLGAISAGLDDRASGPHSTPPPPPSSSELSSPDDGVQSGATWRLTLRPVAVDPVGVLSNATDLPDALLLTLTTAVAASAAEVGLLHRVRSDLGAVVTTGAQGPQAELLLGERLPADDPTLVAASTGIAVVGEPLLGEAGRYIAGRLSRCIPMPRGVAMVPLVVHHELVALFEVGRRTPFRPREIARVEDVVEALAERAVVMGWLDPS